MFGKVALRGRGKLVAAFILVAAAVNLAGCVTVFVDTATTDLTAAQKVHVSNPQPVSVDVAFQTNGKDNPRAAKQVRGWVTKAVVDSGLFSMVDNEPSPGEASLNLTINNIANIGEAAGKGFVTGLTFGAAGSAVTDGYVCTATYTPADGGPAITATATHAIHSTVGAHSAPEGAVASPSLAAAVETMVRQLSANCVNNLAKDDQFPK